MSNYYIDWTDVAGRYPDAAKIADEGKMSESFIRYAEAEVDARLSPMYSVPFNPGSVNAPLAVRDLCIDLAYYKMTWRQEGAQALKDMLDERFARILRGDEILATSAGLAGLNAGTAWSSTEDYHSRFGPDDPVNWTPSSAELTAAEDARW